MLRERRLGSNTMDSPNSYCVVVDPQLVCAFKVFPEILNSLDFSSSFRSVSLGSRSLEHLNVRLVVKLYTLYFYHLSMNSV